MPNALHAFAVFEEADDVYVPVVTILPNFEVETHICPACVEYDFHASDAFDDAFVTVGKPPVDGP